MELPEDCIAKILSDTTPADACRLSLVSKTFYSAAKSDTVWDKFLPSDLMSIISRSDSASFLLANSPSKKSLYLALLNHPIIIDYATKSFQLDRKSGKKCFMFASRALDIVLGYNPECWNWISLPESRFPEVAQLLRMHWLEIFGVITPDVVLSPKTNYAAYLVFKMIDVDGFHHPVKLSIDIDVPHFLHMLRRPRRRVRSPPDGVQASVMETNGDIVGGQSSTTNNFSLDPNLEERQVHNSLLGLQFPNRLRRPHLRSDGWMEIEIGEFYNGVDLIFHEVQMSVQEINGRHQKSGLFIEGIEVRPA